MLEVRETSRTRRRRLGRKGASGGLARRTLDGKAGGEGGAVVGAIYTLPRVRHTSSTKVVTQTMKGGGKSTRRGRAEANAHGGAKGMGDRGLERVRRSIVAPSKMGGRVSGSRVVARGRSASTCEGETGTPDIRWSRWLRDGRIVGGS